MTVTELWKATEPGTTHTLHLIDRATDYARCVVCHNLYPGENGDDPTWDWGTYCDCLQHAIGVFLCKAGEWFPDIGEEL
jgi:hypothetical protein